MSRRGQSLRRAALVAALALGLDQASKALVRSEIEPGERIDLLLGIELVRVSNDGIAFGLLSGTGPALIAVAAAAFTLLLVYFLVTADRKGLWLPIGLLAGGALGNLTDRVIEGSVTDFIDPPNWPAFNVADIEITLGVIILLLLYLITPEDESEREDGEREGERAPE